MNTFYLDNSETALIVPTNHMKTPHLVQRGRIQQTDDFQGIDSLVNFDYMGSAEFEYGALPKALKEICTILPELGFKCTTIEANGKALWLLCKAEDELSLMEWWNKIVNDKHSARTKEIVYYGKKIGDEDTDFWWDIEHNWMATLGGKEIQKVHNALKMVKKKKGWN